ncbi:MAG: biotin/lipoyl-containing protein [Actinomycetota bacterium]
MNDLLLLATEAPASGDDGLFLNGILVTVAFIVVFVGSVWLLTSMILGAKLGYFVTGACLFAVMVLLSAIWVVTALGPKGEQGFWGDLGNDTAWQAVAVGDLGSVSSEWGTWDVSSYPEGEGWVEPGDDVYLADLEGEDSTASEVPNALPIMESFVGQAVNTIPGIRESVADQVQGEVNLEPGSFDTVDVRMQEAEVDGKDSLVAVARVVPTSELTTGDLGGAEEAAIAQFLVEPGDEVSEGDPVIALEIEGETTEIAATESGRIISIPFAEGDLIQAGVPFASIDISGQEGAPEPVEVAAARVRGSVRVPSLIYLGVSLALMVLHLIGVSKTERAARITQPQIA